MKTTHTEEQMQAAIDAACKATASSTLRPIAGTGEVPGDPSSEIIGWRYADEPTPEEPGKPWTPKVGDVVTLKSGGDALTVAGYDEQKGEWRCVSFAGGCPSYLCVPPATLTPA